MHKHIQNLVDKYGSLRNVADKIGLDHGYLHRLRSGEQDNPSTAALKRLGLERQHHYRIVRMP
jgi:transcriptional regulator with XRE-family HTH domain